MAMIFNFSKSAKLKGAEKLKEANINCEISVLLVTTEKKIKPCLIKFGFGGRQLRNKIQHFLFYFRDHCRLYSR